MVVSLLGTFSSVSPASQAFLKSLSEQMTCNQICDGVDGGDESNKDFSFSFLLKE